MVEIWKEIPGWEQYYEVSNFGKIKSKDKNISNGRSKRFMPSKLMKFWIDQKGYSKVYLRNPKKFVYVHRIVALAFLGESNLQVNHIDGNKSNNNITNLEYLTCKENISHAISLGLIDKKGTKHHNVRLTPEIVSEIRLKYSTEKITQKELAQLYNISNQHVSRIINYQNWKNLK